LRSFHFLFEKFLFFVRVTRQHRKNKKQKTKKKQRKQRKTQKTKNKKQKTKNKKQKTTKKQRKKKKEKRPPSTKRKKEKKEPKRKMRLEGADRSRAHFEYARKYAQKGYAMSTKKAIAHFGRGMAYGAREYDEHVLSNAGPYTYHWKLNPASIGANQYHYATIDVRESGKKGASVVATITVYERTYNTFVVHLGTIMECELTRRYVAREVSSVIQYARRGSKVEFDDDSWGETSFDPFNDFKAWEIADEGVFESGGCWPRLGGTNKENSSNSGVIQRASDKASSLVDTMRNMAIISSKERKGYVRLPLGGENRNHPSFGMMGVTVYTNGGSVCKVTSDGRTATAEFLSKQRDLIASLEHSVPKRSDLDRLYYTDVLHLKCSDGNYEQKRAYATLAFTSLMRSLIENVRIVALGDNTQEGLRIAQWSEVQGTLTTIGPKKTPGSSVGSRPQLKSFR
jgi:hypothetical protein